MIRKFVSVIFMIALSACLLAGCGETVSEIAGNVADAAME